MNGRNQAGNRQETKVIILYLTVFIYIFLKMKNLNEKKMDNIDMVKLFLSGI